MTVVDRLIRVLLPALVAVLAAVPAARADDVVRGISVVVDTGGANAPDVTGSTPAPELESAVQQAPANVTVPVTVDSPGAASVTPVDTAAVQAAAPPPPAPPEVATPAAPAPAPAPAAPTAPDPPAPPAVEVPQPPTISAAGGSAQPNAPIGLTRAVHSGRLTAAVAPSAAGAPPRGGGDPPAAAAPPAMDAPPAPAAHRAQPRRHAPLAARHRAARTAAGAPGAAGTAPAPPVRLFALLSPAPPTTAAHRAPARGRAWPQRASSTLDALPTPSPRGPTAPVDLPAAAAAAVAVAAVTSVGTLLVLTLAAALLLTGSAGPYERVAPLRRRAPAGAGGPLERPG
jgi:hypothetical protein